MLTRRQKLGGFLVGVAIASGLTAAIVKLVPSAEAAFPVGWGGGSGGGAVASVTGSNNITCSPTTGAVICSGSALAAKAANLSDLASASTARTNLGLGTMATASTGSFAAVANNLSDLASASTARTNLGLGTAATAASTAFLQLAGVSGGQSAICGTGASDGCTISTSSNGTKGALTVGTSTGLVFNEQTNVLKVGIATPAASAVAHFKQTVAGSTFHVLENSSANSAAASAYVLANADTLAGGGRALILLSGSGASTSGFYTANQLQIITGGTNADMVLAPGGSGGTIITKAGGASAGLEVDTNGNVVCHSAALSASATNGFFYIAGGPGTPGTPATSKTGRYPMYWDTTAKKLLVYDGSWLGATAPGVWSLNDGALEKRLRKMQRRMDALERDELAVRRENAALRHAVMSAPANDNAAILAAAAR